MENERDFIRSRGEKILNMIVLEQNEKDGYMEIVKDCETEISFSSPTPSLTELQVVNPWISKLLEDDKQEESSEENDKGDVEQMSEPESDMECSSDDYVPGTDEGTSSEDYVPGTDEGTSSEDYVPGTDEGTSSEDYVPGTDEETSSSSAIQISKRRDSSACTSSEITELLPSSEMLGQADNVSGVDCLQPATNKKKKIFPKKIKSSRLKSRNIGQWKRNEAAKFREMGHSYISYTGKVMGEKTVSEGILCNSKCKLKCSENIKLEERESILSSFYKCDINSKNMLLFKSISKHDVKRHRKGSNKSKTATYRYHVSKKGEIVYVCKTAFCSLYGIGRKKVDIIKAKVSSGLPAPLPDRRGNHDSRPHKIDPEVELSVMEHIKSFPAEESHYSRNHNPYKKYLSPTLSISKMHKLYNELCQSRNMPPKFNVKMCTYRKIFVTKFNLSFSSPKSDTCGKCDSGEGNSEHIENANAGFEAQKLDRSLAQESNHMAFVTYDLQQTMPLPKITASQAFYLRQLWFYNLGIHVTAKGLDKAIFCTWSEDIAGRGSTEISSALLTAIELDDSLRSKDHLMIWTDSCPGQNKNSQIINLYQYLILKGYFTTIDHEFPEVGHTYLDSDRDFGRIEKNLRKNENVYLPDQYRDIINNTCKKNKVIDMKEHFRSFEKLAKELNIRDTKKDLLNEKVRFRDGVKWIRVEEVGSYLYKESYDIHTPFRKVNLFYNKKKDVNSSAVSITRIMNKEKNVSQEKLQDLKAQLKYVPEDFQWFYKKIMETE